MKAPRLIKKCPNDGIKYPLSFTGVCDSDFHELQGYCEDHEKWVAEGICTGCGSQIRALLITPAGSAARDRLTEAGNNLKIFLDLAGVAVGNTALEAVASAWRTAVIQKAQEQPQAKGAMDFYRLVLRVMPGATDEESELSRLEKELPLLKTQGRESMAAGQWQEAAGQLAEALRRYPEDRELADLQAQAKQGKEKVERLQQDIQQSLIKSEFLRLSQLAEEAAPYRALIDGYDKLVTDSTEAVARAKASTTKGTQWAACGDQKQAQYYFAEALRACSDYQPALVATETIRSTQQKAKRFRWRALMGLGVVALLAVMVCGGLWWWKGREKEEETPVTPVVVVPTQTPLPTPPKPVVTVTPIAPTPMASAPLKSDSVVAVGLKDLLEDSDRYLGKGVRVTGTPFSPEGQTDSFDIRQGDRAISVNDKDVAADMKRKVEQAQANNRLVTVVGILRQDGNGDYYLQAVEIGSN